MKNKFLLLLLILFVVAAVPRGIELLNKNYLWGFDQGEHYLAVKDIVIDHNLTLIGTKVGGAGGFFQGPGWYYLLSIPFVLTGGDPYGGMVLMFLIGFGTVLFSFYLFRKVFDDKVAFIISLLIAISPAIIQQSRFIWPPFPISLLTVFYLFFLFKLLQGRKNYLPYITFVIGMMTHFEIATAGTLIFQFALFSPILFIKRLISLKYLFFSILSFLLTLFPLVLFDFRNQQIVSKGILNMISNKDVVALPFTWIVVNHFSVFKDNFFTTFYGADKFWFLFLAFFIVGSISYLKDKKKTSAQKIFVLYLLFSPVLLFVIFLKYQQGIWNWWILQLPIMYCFLFGILSSQFWQRRYLRIGVGLVLVLFFFSYIKQSYMWYKGDFNDYGGVHKIKGKIDALDFIYQDAMGKPFSLFMFTPPVYTYAYDYLVWWHGQKKYGYLPSNVKKGVFYLWIEPDNSKPWSHKGWMETVIREGKVIHTEYLPSGFIVQKREY